jgi:hypothetical protein
MKTEQSLCQIAFIKILLSKGKNNMKSKASFLDANVVNILDNPKKQWGYHRRKTLGSKRFASFDKKIDWNVFNPKDYLFTHSTIVSSVKV